MVREGFTPAPHTIHTLIKGYADAGATGDCVEFFHVLRRAGVATPARDVHSILTVMLELSEHQQATHLLEFFARENTWLDLESCSILQRPLSISASLPPSSFYSSPLPPLPSPSPLFYYDDNRHTSHDIREDQRS